MPVKESMWPKSEERMVVSMNRGIKIGLTFGITLITSFFIVGYIINNTWIQINWDENATIWDKFREYYVRTFIVDFIAAILIAFIITGIMVVITRKK